ncbi:alpha/beta hydrolase [Allorhodopirellula solitaria]|nr:alpha/beta hydrolase-fold protein [Allorhodopirellula solitaria]
MNITTISATFAGVLAFTLAALPVSAQPPIPSRQQPADPAEHATDVLDIESAGQRSYRIFISVPGPEPPPGGYSVTYVLDGNAYFADVVRARDALAELRRTMVVVGIGYPIEGRIDFVRRTFDLTPPAEQRTLPPRRGGDAWPTWGGADVFLQFIETELKPQLQNRYAIDQTKQTIFGHSFGGLFVLHTLFTRPGCFQTYIAASPSVWWNDYAIGEAAAAFGEKHSQGRTSLNLVLTVGELELGPDAGPAAALDETEAKRQFGTTEDFADRMETLQDTQLQVTSKIFPDASHGDAAPQAIVFGMNQL